MPTSWRTLLAVLLRAATPYLLQLTERVLQAVLQYLQGASDPSTTAKR